MQEQEKEIFQHYEIRNWNYSSRLYKILGAAAVFNLLALFVMGQTDMLTTRGCDSPMVSRVCQVIDTIYVGSTILAEDSEFVSKDYEKIVLEDAEITYIDVSGVTPPLTYPEGYFALANPESQFMAMNNPTDFSANMTTIPGFPPFPSNPTVTGGNDLMNTPQVTPTPNNKAIIGNIPTEPFNLGDNPTTTPLRDRKYPKTVTKRPNKSNSPEKLPNLDGDEKTAENKTDDKKNDAKPDENKSAPVAGIEINKKPFEDLGDSINEKIAKNEIDLTKPFLVVLDGMIAADGTLDKKSKYIKSDGDEKMVLVAKDVIQAVGNSKFLSYLKNNGIDRVNFTLVQDDKQIYIKIISDQKTPEKAGTTASGLNMMLSGMKLLDKNGLTKLDDNSKTLIDNSQVTSEGKNFVLNFVLPKQNAQDIINRELKKRAEKKAVEQPNGNAEVNRNSNANLSR